MNTVRETLRLLSISRIFSGDLSKIGSLFFQNYLETIGAEVVKLKYGRVGYKINEDTFVGEQVLGAGHAAVGDCTG